MLAKIKKNLKLKVKKITTVISTLAIVVNVFMPGAFLIPVPAAYADEPQQMCSVPIDVVLMLDTSGSMAEGESPNTCEWWNLETVGPSQQCVRHIDYNKTESWCNTKHVPQCDLPIFYPATPKKITAAKDAANSFIDNLGPNDQSAIGFFNTTASLEKYLSNNHQATKDTIDGLVPSGSTNIGDAIALANTELGSVRANPQAVKAIILLTDGKANKPNGPGYSEYPADVTYAENMAAEAADPSKNYKIFTIGLGEDDEINETMLQNIANITGAKYYYAPDGNGLEEIYNQIALEVCQYSSISGCKYNDANKNGLIDSGENTIPNWTVTLTNGVVEFTQTTIDGCYSFSGLPPDTYTLGEELPSGEVWITTAEPTNPIQIDWDQHLTGMNFLNYQPICGNQFIDIETNEVCERDQQETRENEQTGYIETRYCNYDCLGWSGWIGQSCGDGEINGNEQCDGGLSQDDPHYGDPRYTCSATQCTIVFAPICNDGNRDEPEQCEGDSQQSCPLNNGYTGSQACNQCQWGVCESIGESCGDGTVNGLEICDNGVNNGTPGYCNNDCSGLTGAVCGNNIREGTEQCDGSAGVTTGFHCTQTCSLEEDQTGSAICGNGVTETGESCDDGISNGTYGFCNSDCSGQTAAICGNGVPEGSEACDNGQSNGEHQICSSQCTLNAICNNGVDDDGDQLIDQLDPGCHTDGDVNNSQSYDPTDNDETDAYTIKAGDIVINEIMQNPKKVSDLNGEWFEVYNITSHDIDLNSCVIADSGSNYHTIGSALVVPAHGYAVLGNNNNKSTNGGVDVNYKYSGFVLNNTSDEIILACGGIEIDRVEYDGGPNFPNPDGKSMTLASPFANNNVGSNWCMATSPFGLGDKGTPGAANDPCAGICASSVAGKKYNNMEQPLTGWTIQLYDNQDAFLTSTMTSETGDYYFGNLCLGSYKIKEILQTGWAQTAPVDNGGAHLVTIETEDTNLTGLDFWNVQYSSIVGYKYQDDDGDVLTTTDQTKGLQNWTINLFKNGEQTAMATTTTDAAGHFQFNNLLPGEYILTEILLTGWTQLDAPATVTLSAGTSSTDNNFINYYSGGKGGEEQVCGNNIREGEEICDGSDGATAGYHCTQLCTLEADQAGGGGGGGGGGSAADVCGDGILNEKTEQCDGIYGTPAGYFCTDKCQLQKTEISAPEEEGGIGGGPTEETGGTGGGPGEIGGGLAVVSPVIAGEAIKEPEQEVPAVPNEMVLGAKTECPLCGWPSWMLAVLLLAGQAAIYYYIFRARLNSAKGDDQKA